MSNFRGSGPFEDAEMIGRRLDEIRRRSMHQVGVGPFANLGNVRDGPPQPPPHPTEYSQHLSILQQAAAANQRQQQHQSPPGYPGYPGANSGALPHGHSPYSRVNNPYGAIGDARAGASAYQQGGPGGSVPLSQMYPGFEERQRQHQAAAAAGNNYGVAYGNGATPPSSGHPSLEHHYASAYGITPVNPSNFARESPYGAGGGAGGQSPHDLAMILHHQQQQQYQQQVVQPQPKSDLYNEMSTSTHSRNIGSNGNEEVLAVNMTPTASTNSFAKATPSTYSSNLSPEGTPDSESRNHDPNNMNESSHTLDATASLPASALSTPAKNKQIVPGSRSPKSNSGGKKVSSSGGKEKGASSTARISIIDGATIIEYGDQRWFTGCVPLGLDDDKYWLSELQVYLRSNFAESFGATDDDIAAPMHGRNKPIALGQVGIRCMHCKFDNPAERGQQATSYPSLISGIYNSVQQMLRLHLDCCLSMPVDVRTKIEQLKSSCSSRGGRKQYWIDSAKRLGLVDTPHGIHFGRDPNGPLPPLAGPSVNSKEGRNKKKVPSKIPDTVQDVEMDEESPPPEIPSSEDIPVPVHEESSPAPAQQVDNRPLVFPDDKNLISDYLYLTLEQMAPCVLMEADRVGCYKTRKVGFPGLSCKHCVGQAGCGRYFPASEASLSQTTTSQTIMNHVRNCRRCPLEIRDNLEVMKRNRTGPDGKRTDKPKHGGRKVFFHRLWCRIQNLPFDEGKSSSKGDKKRKKKKQSVQSNKPKITPEDGSKMDSDDETSTDRSTDLSSDEETESEEDTDQSDDESKDSSSNVKQNRKSSLGSSSSIVPKTNKKSHSSGWFHGCVRLTKTDDPQRLSEMETFCRSDLVEVFSYKEGSHIDGFASRTPPSEGQVGIRCVFCKNLEPGERSNSWIAFPETLSSIQSKVAYMLRIHFPSCPAIPKNAVQTFKSYRGFDFKVANDDSQQYWVDSARDIGVTNVLPASQQITSAWGLTFRRDPEQPSPADELDLELSDGSGPFHENKNAIVRFEDRGLCTDQVLLLLLQIRPCRFQANDRRAGPGSRGRDRSMGFPGLCCVHCAGKNSLGRYFPVSAKNLTDSTINSLQAHLASCAHCPESIKASLAYLGHRSIRQKAELSGSWKKSFFKKVWDRLHVERNWTSLDDEIQSEDADDIANDMMGEEDDEDPETVETPDMNDEDERKDDENGADGGSDSENEDLGDQMNRLIKAAAIWLTEQDNAESKLGSRAKKQVHQTQFGRASSLPTSKRRKVHF